jgi:hypothetical protein
MATAEYPAKIFSWKPAQELRPHITRGPPVEARHAEPSPRGPAAEDVLPRTYPLINEGGLPRSPVTQGTNPPLKK